MKQPESTICLLKHTRFNVSECSVVFVVKCAAIAIASSSFTFSIVHSDDIQDPLIMSFSRLAGNCCCWVVWCATSFRSICTIAVLSLVEGKGFMKSLKVSERELLFLVNQRKTVAEMLPLLVGSRCSWSFGVSKTLSPPFVFLMCPCKTVTKSFHGVSVVSIPNSVAQKLYASRFSVDSLSSTCGLWPDAIFAIRRLD